MTPLAPPSSTCSGCAAREQNRSRLRRSTRTLLRFCLTSAAIVVLVLVAPHLLHAVHPGPTGGGG